MIGFTLGMVTVSTYSTCFTDFSGKTGFYIINSYDSILGLLAILVGVVIGTSKSVL